MEENWNDWRNYTDTYSPMSAEEKDTLIAKMRTAMKKHELRQQWKKTVAYISNGGPLEIED